MNLWNDPDKDFWFEVTQIVVHLTHIFSRNFTLSTTIERLRLATKHKSKRVSCPNSSNLNIVHFACTDFWLAQV